MVQHFGSDAQAAYQSKVGHCPENFVRLGVVKCCGAEESSDLNSVVWPVFLGLRRYGHAKEKNHCC